MSDDQKFDPVQKPKHYNLHVSGVEAIEICEYMAFNAGNALKYCWRAGLKGNEVEDLRKALWYIKRGQRQMSIWQRLVRHLQRVVKPELFSDDEWQILTEMPALVFMAKVIEAEPDGLLARLFTRLNLKHWEKVVTDEIAKRTQA